MKSSLVTICQFKHNQRKREIGFSKFGCREIQGVLYGLTMAHSKSICLTGFNWTNLSKNSVYMKCALISSLESCLQCQQELGLKSGHLTLKEVVMEVKPLHAVTGEEVSLNLTMV